MSGNSRSGRHPKPAALRVLEGNRSKTPIPAEPAFRPGLADPPEDMSADGKEMWTRLLGWLGYIPGLLQEPDWLVMRLACDAYADYAELKRDIRANGRTYQAFVMLDETGKPLSVDMAKVTWKPRPEVLMAERARKALDGYLSRLGLSPVDRMKLAVKEPENKDSLLT